MSRFGGALLADPVGSGKTYIALAVATAANRGTTACVVPAGLQDQWQATADHLSIPVALCSHEQISRGRFPAATQGLVIIDESHHFRNPRTLRYRNLAPRLVGRSALLMSATPIVNRTTDLLHQLLLAIRDDALILHGIPSLTAMLGGRAHPALGQLVFEQEAATLECPGRSYVQSAATDQENDAISRCVDQLGRLQLSRSPPVAALIRSVLFRALGSSPSAYTAALRRYRTLLRQARDAEHAGRSFDRAALRRFTGEMEDQLVFWELFSSSEIPPELELADLERLDELLSETAAAPVNDDGKLHRLRRWLSDCTPTLVFTGSRDTAGYLRRQLHDLGIAWCTGDRAGIGSTTLPRRAVLSWFRQPVAPAQAPRHLVVTDVAAEGLNLPRAARVIHYDLPWTPMRLEQREGRSIRYGSLHPTVQIIQFRLPPILEQQLGMEATLARKERLPGAAGLGRQGKRLWRWRSEIADEYAALDGREGTACVSSEMPGLLAGFALSPPDHPSDAARVVIWLEADGSWTEEPEVLAARLEAAARDRTITPIPPDEVSEWLSLLAKPVRERLAFTRSRRWITPEPTSAGRRLLTRLQQLVKNAARVRDAAQLAELERAMAFVAGGHTAGEAALLERLAHAGDAELRQLVDRLPRRRNVGDHLEVRLTGLILFQAPHRVRARVLSPDAATADRPVRS